MLTDMVRAIIASQSDFDLVGEVVGLSGLADIASDVAADVVILGRALSSEGALRVLYRAPRTKIVAIDNDGRRGVLHELQLKHTALAEISPKALVTTIRNAASISRQGEPS
jgi:DNA-binding NarL/FixJ family response regulator